MDSEKITVSTKSGKVLREYTNTPEGLEYAVKYAMSNRFPQFGMVRPRVILDNKDVDVGNYIDNMEETERIISIINSF